MDPSRSIEPEPLLQLAPFVHRLARALLRDEGRAHDVAQDALTAALQQSEPPRHLRGWLAAVTRRLAQRAVRRERAQQRREQRIARPEASDDAARTQQRLRLQRVLADAVLALPEPYRTTVTLRYLDELEPATIARRLGERADTVRQRLHRGLLLLRQRLDRDGVGDGAEAGADPRDWRAAFAAAGLGAHALPWTLSLPVLAVKKTLAAAAALCFVAVTAVWIAQAEPSAPTLPSTAPEVAAAAPETPSTAAAPATPNADAAQDRRGATRTAAELLLVVTDERSLPLPRVDVHLWTDDGALLQGRTDADGVAAFAALDRPGHALLRAPGRQFALRDLPRLGGDLVIALPDGAAVSGRLLVDGAPAEAGLTLWLRGTPPPPPHAPAAVRELLTRWNIAIPTAITAGGAFAFRGLGPDWSGALRLPRTHWLVPDPAVPNPADAIHSLKLDSPRDGLELVATALDSVHGRVVWDDDGAPVADAGVWVLAEFGPHESSPSTGAACDDDGCFATGLETGRSNRVLQWSDPAQRQRPTAIHIEARHPLAGAAATVRLEGDAVTDDVLRGRARVVLRLVRAPTIHVRVTDPDGAPIAGARIDGRDDCAPTDRDGRAAFGGTLRERRTLVDGCAVIGAPGRQIVPLLPSAPGSGTAEDPLLVTLPPANAVELRVRSAAGPPPAVRIRLDSAAYPFAGRRRQAELDRAFGCAEVDTVATGRHQPDGTTTWTEFTTRCEPDADGRVMLRSLEPQLPITVVVEDWLRSELVRRELTAPAPGEHIEVDLEVAVPSRRVRGRVLGGDGAPLPGAKVVLRRDREASTEFAADADGRFAQTVYNVDALELLVRADGFAPERRVLPPGDAELTMVLSPACSVEVRVVDPDGTPVAVFARPEGHDDYNDQQHLGDGHCRWANLPHGTVTFVCELGGERFSLEHDTQQPEAVLTVPKPARVRVPRPADIADPDPHQGYLGVVATRLDAPGMPVPLALADAPNPRPNLLLPGRYRIALLMREWVGEPRRLVVRELGPAAEIELVAGQETTVELR